MGEVASLTWIGLFAVLFSDVELPESGSMVASAVATDEDASTDDVVLALVDVEDKTVEVDDETVDADEETDREVTVGSTDVDVVVVAVVLAESDSERKLALGADDSPVESPSQELYTAAYSISSMFS